MNADEDFKSVIDTLFANALGSTYLLRGTPGPSRIHHGPHAQDLRWKLDGRALVVCVGEPIVYTRTKDAKAATFTTDNAAATLHFRAPRGFGGAPPSLPDAYAVSADFDRRGRLITAWSDGRIQRTSPDETTRSERDADESTTLGHPRRVRVSPSLDIVALTAEPPTPGTFQRQLHLWRPGEGAPRHVPLAIRGLAEIAWSPDGRELAVAAPEGVFVLDAEGNVVRHVTFDWGGNETWDLRGMLAWSQAGIAAMTEESLLLIDAEGAIRRVWPRSESDDPGAPGSLAASPDGRYLAAFYAHHGKPSLRFFDVATGAMRVLSWTIYVCNGPIGFAPTGDAIAWVEVGAELYVKPWDPRVSRDPDGEELARIKAMVAAGDLEEALAALRAFQPRPSRKWDANILFKEIELAQEARKAKPKPVEPEAATFGVGAAVVHAKYGDGTVTAIDGKGPTAKVTVDFAGTKRTLQASFLRAGG